MKESTLRDERGTESFPAHGISQIKELSYVKDKFAITLKIVYDSHVLHRYFGSFEYLSYRAGWWRSMY